MLFEQLAGAFELLVDLGHPFGHLIEVHRRANSGDDVFTLGVDQEIAVESLLAGRRIAREANARARVFSLITEDHLHDVNSGAEQTGNVLDAAVGNRLFSHPGLKHSADRAPELFRGMLGKRLARFLLKVRLVLSDQLLPTLGGYGGIVLDVETRLHSAKFYFKIFFG